MDRRRSESDQAVRTLKQLSAENLEQPQLEHVASKEPFLALLDLPVHDFSV